MNMQNNKVVVIYSGGMDSFTVLNKALHNNGGCRRELAFNVKLRGATLEASF
jgi:PP-loop superfamily ATP-utilizing enzyme